MLFPIEQQFLILFQNIFEYVEILFLFFLIKKAVNFKDSDK